MKTEKYYRINVLKSNNNNNSKHIHRTMANVGWGGKNLVLCKIVDGEHNKTQHNTTQRSYM